jgi:hypothetical protein
MEKVPEAVEHIISMTIEDFDNHLMMDDEAREWFEQNRNKVLVMEFNIEETGVSVQPHRREA